MVGGLGRAACNIRMILAAALFCSAIIRRHDARPTLGERSTNRRGRARARGQFMQHRKVFAGGTGTCAGYPCAALEFERAAQRAASSICMFDFAMFDLPRSAGRVNRRGQGVLPC
jgi:hypothetical protein